MVCSKKYKRTDCNLDVVVNNFWRAFIISRLKKGTFMSKASDFLKWLEPRMADNAYTFNDRQRKNLSREMKSIIKTKNTGKNIVRWIKKWSDICTFPTAARMELMEMAAE